MGDRRGWQEARREVSGSQTLWGLWAPPTPVGTGWDRSMGAFGGEKRHDPAAWGLTGLSGWTAGPRAEAESWAGWLVVSQSWGQQMGFCIYFEGLATRSY